jgi:hypothetical protein
VDTSWIKDLSQFGGGIVLAVLVFVAYERHVTSLQAVIATNAEAMTRVAQLLEQQCAKLDLHDGRADRMENGMRHISEAVDRIEAKPIAARARAPQR